MRRRGQRATILIDTREKLPFVFPKHTTRKAKLNTGDYSLLGLRDRVVVERKGFGDFLNCTGSGWAKFMAPKGQVDRLHHMEFSLLVVEGTMRRIRSNCYDQHRMTEFALTKRIAELSMWVPIVLCDTRIMARNITLEFLLKARQLIQEERNGC